MLVAVNGTTGAVLLAAQVTALGGGYAAISAGHAAVAGNVTLTATQVTGFVTDKLVAAYAPVNAALFYVVPVVNNRGAGLCFGHGGDGNHSHQ